MFVPCTALLCDSTTATQTLKLSTTLLRISCGIHLISFLMIPSLVCGLFSQTLSFRFPSENSQAGWDLGNRMARGYRFNAKWVCPMGSYVWGIQVFCLRNSEYIIRKETRRVPQEMLNRVVDNFNVWVAAVLSCSSVMHGTNIVLITTEV